jgi:hypothetical protein
VQVGRGELGNGTGEEGEVVLVDPAGPADPSGTAPEPTVRAPTVMSSSTVCGSLDGPAAPGSSRHDSRLPIADRVLTSA